jgi:uncharacterized protein YjbI with pentapeptide repeats
MNRLFISTPDRQRCRSPLEYGRLISVAFFFALLLIGPNYAISSVNIVGREELELKKLSLENTRLQLENKKIDSCWTTAISLAPFITTIVSILGVLITLSKHLSEQTRQRSLDRTQVEAERIQRFNEKFTSVIENLGSQSISIQASAAVSILTFLRTEYAEFHEQVFLLLLANLKVGHNEVIEGLLTKCFEKAVRLKADGIAAENEQIEDKDEKIVLDLSACTLMCVNLCKVNLGWADLRKSSMRNANIRETKLIRVRGEGADFEGAKGSGAKCEKARFDGACFKDASLRSTDLKWTHFKNATLTNCQFQQAHLQGAHLEFANLEGARFEQADLNNAFFTGAKLDETTKISIVKAYNWRLAHFDPGIIEELQKLEQRILAIRRSDEKPKEEATATLDIV